jgi:hypothetical protein
MVHSGKKKNGQKGMNGFLIAEATISLFVLTAGLIAVMALISSSLKYSIDNRDTIIAVELAQEGVELVCNVRDNGFINNPANPFFSFSAVNKHCRITYNSALVCTGTVQSAGTYALLYAGGYYSYGDGKFHRYVYVNYNNIDTAIVKSFVYWDPNLFTPPNNGDPSLCTIVNKCVFTEITLTNWK